MKTIKHKKSKLVPENMALITDGKQGKFLYLKDGKITSSKLLNSYEYNMFLERIN